jgi:uncharacterized membrane protein
MKILQRIGWGLSYFQILVLIPFGTCTQGDDDPWRASLMCSVVPLIGLILILVSSKEVRKSLMGIPHIFTLLLILWNTPSYWIRVTFQGQHICAGFHNDYMNSFEPELWHRMWAPYVTIIGFAFVLMGAVCLKNHIKERRTNALTLKPKAGRFQQ